MRVLLVVVILFALGGCASKVPAYKAPENGPMADLVIRTETPGINMGIVRFMGSLDRYYCSAGGGEIIAILHNKSLFRSFADGGADIDHIAVKIPATGEPFRLLMNVGHYELKPLSVTTYGCQAHSSFIPVPGGRYEATYNYSKSPCAFDVRGSGPNETTKDIPVKQHPMCVNRVLEGQGDLIELHVKKQYLEHPEWYTQ